MTQSITVETEILGVWIKFDQLPNEHKFNESLRVWIQIYSINKFKWIIDQLLES